MPSFTTAVGDLLVGGPVVQIFVGPSTALAESVAARDVTLAVPVQVTALVDTGASGTVLNPEIIRRLGLSPVGTALIHTPSTTVPVQCNRYQVNVYFPHDVVVEDVVAIEAPLGGQSIQCLIGRDVLRNGLLIYVGHANQFTLAF